MRGSREAKQIKREGPMLPLKSSAAALALLSALLMAALTPSVSAAAAAGPHMSAKQRHRTSERVIEHHSFSPPLLRNNYGEDEVRHWAIGGTTVITDDHIRLTGDHGGQIGHLWNTEPLDMNPFEVVIGFHVHGSGSGADGFAFWLTTDRPTVNGPLMGRAMQFNGIGVIFDTFDNDGLRDNPTVLVLVNNDNTGQGRREYSPQKDFKGEHAGSCRFNFRQTSTLLSTARIRYDKDVLTVYMSRDAEENEVLCTTVSGVHLDTNKREYYIGLSAETGDLADNHDIVFVHTMPIEGATYDHDVYSTPTVAEEANKNGVPPVTGEQLSELEKLRKLQEQQKQHQQQDQQRLGEEQPPPPQQQQAEAPPQQQQAEAPPQQQQAEAPPQQQQAEAPPQQQQAEAPPQQQQAEAPPQQQQAEASPQQHQDKKAYASDDEHLKELQRELEELMRRRRALHPDQQRKDERDDEEEDEEDERDDDMDDQRDYVDGGYDKYRRGPRRYYKPQRVLRRRRRNN